MIFKHCPICTSDKIEYDNFKKYYCPSCDFTYYHNPAAAVAGLILFDEKLLLIKRAQNPGKGKLDLPGGFVDPGESAEDALKREIFEELRVQVSTCRYFTSVPNIYEYKDITYSTCDVIFEITIDQFPQQWNKDEIEDVILVSPGSANIPELAFSSSKIAVERYLKQRHFF